MEGPDEILAFGLKRHRAGDKNAQALLQIEQLVERWRPHRLALQDVDATDSRRANRIRELYAAIVHFADLAKIKIKKHSGKQLRVLLLNNPKCTKHEMALEIARRFPDVLADKLPPKRRAWDDENWRMGIFDAAALAIAFWL